jgi:hypothetical protein
MGIIKGLYEEIKYSGYNIKNHTGELFENIYYGVFKKDEYSRSHILFNLKRVFSEILHPFRYIKNGFRNLKKWYYVIWEDRQYDYGYMEKLIHHKLTLMEEFFKSNDVHSEEAKNCVKDITKAKEIIYSLMNNTYEDGFYDEYYKKYPHRDLEFKPFSSEKERIDKGLPVRLYSMVDNRTDEEVEVFRKLIGDCNEERDRLRDELYTILKEKSEYWWD